MRASPIVIKRVLESAKGKPLKWAVRTKNNSHLLALFVFESAAHVYAAGGGGGRVVEEIGK